MGSGQTHRLIGSGTRLRRASVSPANGVGPGAVTGTPIVEGGRQGQTLECHACRERTQRDRWRQVENRHSGGCGAGEASVRYRESRGVYARHRICMTRRRTGGGRAAVAEIPGVGQGRARRVGGPGAVEGDGAAFAPVVRPSGIGDRRLLRCWRTLACGPCGEDALDLGAAQRAVVDGDLIDFAIEIRRWDGRNAAEVGADAQVGGLSIEERLKIWISITGILELPVHVERETSGAVYRGNDGGQVIPRTGRRRGDAPQSVHAIACAIRRVPAQVADVVAAAEAEHEVVVTSVVIRLEEAPTVCVTSGHLVHDRHVAVWDVETHPGLHGEVTGGYVEVGRITCVDVIVDAIQEKGLTHLAWRETGAIQESAVVAVHDVVRVALSWPPTHDTRWRRCAAIGWSRCQDLEYRSEE